MKKAFTMAEVLITIGIIGLVASMTLPSLYNHINSKGYVERLKKAHSLLQNATNLIISDYGQPEDWIPDGYKIGNEQGADAAISAAQGVVNLYAKQFNTVYICEFSGASSKESNCNLNRDEYKGLNGQPVGAGNGSLPPYYYVYPIVLSDGSSIAFRFQRNQSGGYFWGTPLLTFIVDVNGLQRPNTVGRDIFYLYLNEQGSVLPYGDGNFGEDDCNTNGKGESCAYKVLTEDRMNY